MATNHKREKCALEKAIITNLLFDMNSVFEVLEEDALRFVETDDAKADALNLRLHYQNLDQVKEIGEIAYTLTNGHPGEVLEAVNSSLVQNNLGAICSFVLEIITSNYQLLVTYNHAEDELESDVDFSMLDTVVLEGLYQSTIGALLEATIEEEDSIPY